MKKLFTAGAVIFILAALSACGGKKETESTANELSGSVHVDGSSTVFPITEAVAEEFRALAPKVRVTVGVSGTGGGFKKFVLGETDINDASRTIKSSEAEKAAEHGISYIEVPVAFDGISVVIHPENTWVDYLTVEELNLIWKSGSTVKTWKDIRPEWPDREIKLFGPGTDSGTFDYFTEVINGKSRNCRPDYTMSEDDNVLVMGVAGDQGALGFFGYAYYLENRDRVKAVPISNAGAPVAPTALTINDGSYSPLSRPIFIYINPASLDRPQVASFVNFYLKNARHLVQEVGYIELSDKAYELAAGRVSDRITGSAFSGASHESSVEEILSR